MLVQADTVVGTLVGIAVERLGVTDFLDAGCPSPPNVLQCG